MADPTTLADGLRQFLPKAYRAVADRGDTVGTSQLTSPTGESATLEGLPAMLAEVNAARNALDSEAAAGGLVFSRLRMRRA